ncbi:S-adenosylmethionine tRNA ribosyltransferase [Streptomyces sp. RSD-27]|nr:S-adenosylmethionine tRNA ribosyltransferase [Streptomyces sp. RSD-27]
MADDGRCPDRRLEQVILDLLDRRGHGASICPSDAARAAYAGGDDGWRTLMEPVRRAARRLVTEGAVEITQGGRPVEPAKARGPVRIRRTP